MIKLYREENSPQADVIEAEFRELVLGYERVLIEKKDAVPLFGIATPLPVILNNERVVSGEGIPAYLKELTQLIGDWQLFQNHCCYVDDDGENC
jgi:hypothetical protein